MKRATRSWEWTEWAVVLPGGLICPAASRAVALFYGAAPGRPVLSRPVTLAPGGAGAATVSYGDWVPLRGAA